MPHIRSAPTKETASKENPFVIRRAVREDLDDIVNLWCEGAFEAWGVKPPERSAVQEFFSRRFNALALPYGIWVATRGDEILGWQGLQQHYPNPLFQSALSSTYIRDTSRRTGVGRTLLKFAMEYARTTAIQNIFGHIFCKNHIATQLVESLGWTRVGIIPFAGLKLYYYHFLVS
jgi:L-amino acid N-acyltransferase YncA